MNEKDVKIGRKYLVLPNPQLHIGADRTPIPCDAIAGGDVVTVMREADSRGDFAVSVVGEDVDSYTSAEFLEEIYPKEPLAEWERELLEGQGSFFLELTEQEVDALADPRRNFISPELVSVAAKAKALLPKRKITIELDENEAQDLIAGGVPAAVVRKIHAEGI